MKVKFLETRTVKAAEGETFEQGKVYDLPDASAQRWIRRGVAVEATAEPKTAAKVEDKASKSTAGGEKK